MHRWPPRRGEAEMFDGNSHLAGVPDSVAGQCVEKEQEWALKQWGFDLQDGGFSFNTSSAGLVCEHSVSSSLVSPWGI